MACSQKRLRDHLREQQDPFVLRIYLAERRIVLNKFSMGQGSCKSKEKVSRTRNALKFIFDMFISNSQRQQVSNKHNKTHQDELTSLACHDNPASSLARISPDVKESTFNEKQAAAGIKLQRGSKEDSKQLRISSVLGKVSSSNKAFLFQTNEEAAISSTRNGKADDLQVEKRKIAKETEEAITDSIIQETIDFLIEQNSVMLNEY